MDKKEDRRTEKKLVPARRGLLFGNGGHCGCISRRLFRLAMVPFLDLVEFWPDDHEKSVLAHRDLSSKR
ncbi:MAG: hypothetical protein AAB790_03235 [Patescibacteria group bacterium]